MTTEQHSNNIELVELMQYAALGAGYIQKENISNVDFITEGRAYIFYLRRILAVILEGNGGTYRHHQESIDQIYNHVTGRKGLFLRRVTEDDVTDDPVFFTGWYRVQEQDEAKSTIAQDLVGLAAGYIRSENITENDVKSERGSGGNYHPGNIAYIGELRRNLDVIRQQNEGEYRFETRHIDHIYNFVTGPDRQGMFLKQVTEHIVIDNRVDVFEWFKIQEERVVRTKIATAYRDHK